MKNTKTEIRFFSIMQWKKEEEYLRQQHKNGWEFVWLNGLCLYHFQKCEPKDVVYQLDYNHDSVSKRREYLQIFSDCGWEYLQNYAGYSYFRKEASEMNGTQEEIFCDDDSRLDILQRIFRKRMIPLFFVFLFVLIPQIIMQSCLDTPYSYGFLIVFGILFGIYLAIFVSFGFSFWKYYTAVYKK